MSDIVACSFCGIQLGIWKEDDDVILDHRIWSPNCPFVLNPDFIDNITIAECPKPKADNPAFERRLNSIRRGHYISDMFRRTVIYSPLLFL